MQNKRFKKAKPILELIEKHGHKAYFVGGCVRDLLLKRSIKDIDITTSATPEEIKKIFPKVIPVGIQHGTVIVRFKKESYEVTTFRLDGDYSDGRHPDTVEFTDDIDKDLERRDFTINALAMNVRGDIIDLFNGQKDMEKRLIRTVGNGSERFREDALRIIRALRFSSQLGFSLAQDTYEQMIACKSDIKLISTERITNEMGKFFAGDYIEKGIEYLRKTEIYRELPIFKDVPSLINKVPVEIKPLPSFASVIVLFHYLEPKITITSWVKSWKCSNQTKRSADEIFDNLRYYEKNGLDRILVYRLKQQHYVAFQRLIEMLKNDQITISDIEKIKVTLPIHSRKELAIDGNDILELFPQRTRGAWIKEMLEESEEQVIKGNVINKKREIKEWLQWNQREVN